MTIERVELPKEIANDGAGISDREAAGRWAGLLSGGQDDDNSAKPATQDNAAVAADVVADIDEISAGDTPGDELAPGDDDEAADEAEGAEGGERVSHRNVARPSIHVVCL